MRFQSVGDAVTILSLANGLAESEGIQMMVLKVGEAGIWEFDDDFAEEPGFGHVDIIGVALDEVEVTEDNRKIGLGDEVSKKDDKSNADFELFAGLDERVDNLEKMVGLAFGEVERVAKTVAETPIINKIDLAPEIFHELLEITQIGDNKSAEHDSLEISGIGEGEKIEVVPFADRFGDAAQEREANADNAIMGMSALLGEIGIGGVGEIV